MCVPWAVCLLDDFVGVLVVELDDVFCWLCWSEIVRADWSSFSRSLSSVCLSQSSPAPQSSPPAPQSSSPVLACGVVAVVALSPLLASVADSSASAWF
jgi:hypothetical protein